MRRDAVLASQQASVRRAVALQQLATDPEATIADAAHAYQEQAIWLDITAPGMQHPIAVSLAEDAAKRIEGEISVQILGQAPRLWDLAQRKAAEIVAEVAALPEMPRQIWEVSDPAGEFARFLQHRSSWGVLTAAYNDFELCFAIGNLVRDTLGYSYAKFTLGATRSALWLKNWRKELADDGAFDRQKAPMRLPYAIARGFEPGIWAPKDAEDSTAADKSFGGRLKNLGIAVGVNI